MPSAVRHTAQDARVSIVHWTWARGTAETIVISNATMLVQRRPDSRATLQLSRKLAQEARPRAEIAGHLRISTSASSSTVPIRKGSGLDLIGWRGGERRRRKRQEFADRRTFERADCVRPERFRGVHHVQRVALCLS